MEVPVSDKPCEKCSVVEVSVQRENVRRDGYTKGGTYYGFVAGTDVFSYTAEVPTQDQQTGEWETRTKYGTERAANMNEAKAKIRRVYPHAKFVR